MFPIPEYLFEFFKKSAPFQTQFDSTNIGSKVYQFNTTAIYFCQFSIGMHCSNCCKIQQPQKACISSCLFTKILLQMRCTINTKVITGLYNSTSINDLLLDPLIPIEEDNAEITFWSTVGACQSKQWWQNGQVGVVDFMAEDKCVPAHLVSPNFSSSSLDSQQLQWKKEKSIMTIFFS